MELKSIFSYLKSKVFNKVYRKSYSQLGEDLIVRYLFDDLKIDKPTYIDIGANDPYILSNTAFFYKSGCKGINIEPNPVLCKKIRNKRH